ncbi:MAG TPA: saccharopine dehydrogenase C-terminal domain-containing protein [Ferruginibacter sp.]|nr:saccharopine dehydrogenase [Chitinophagaceae bacterium]HRI23120.1 saccharopine dehydrogenase C-terminal domain-containing protein [Ferruginibacter sp.]
MKTILLIGAGKSATVLIDYLIKESEANNWKFIIADSNRDLILTKTNHSPFAEAVQLDVINDEQRSKLIQRAHVVISMMPPALHFLVAKDCVEYRKHLLTASYLDDKIRSLQDEINDRKLFFLCEMGLDPGIDHMSAMKIIDEIKATGGKITSFKSHCGGLVAPESDDNPWHYKISWNPRNIVMAGQSGAVYKENNEIKNVSYQQLFDVSNGIVYAGLDSLAFYPNRDSLSYISTYKLPDTATFIRTTLRHIDFFKGWNAVVHAGLTNETDTVNTKGLTFKKWSEPVNHFVTAENEAMLRFLGLFEETPVPASAKSSADILQHLVETRLGMHSGDKDMIVMLHEFVYNLDGEPHSIQSCLVAKGEDSLRTAMAKTVGLPLGIAAKFILDGTLQLKGLHIPTSREIYEPVLKELESAGIRFTETRN